MSYTDPTAPTRIPTESMQEGDDFFCSNCGCEIRLRHHGDPAKMENMGPFICPCGTPMTKEERTA